jgi:hypothetical protein
MYSVEKAAMRVEVMAGSQSFATQYTHHSQAGGIPSIACAKMFRADGTADAGRMPAQGKATKAVEQAAVFPFACTRSAYHLQPPQHIFYRLGSCMKLVSSLRTQQELYRRLYVAVRRRVGGSTATSLPSPYALTSLSIALVCSVQQRL